jgi:hypothetical protein
VLAGLAASLLVWVVEIVLDARGMLPTEDQRTPSGGA